MNITINHSVAFKSNKPRIFESIAEKTIKQMQTEGRVTTISSEATAAIDDTIAVGFKKIISEYRVKRQEWLRALKNE